LLIATNYLSKEKYLRYKEKGVKIFLFNEIDFSTVELKDDIFYNCNSEKVPSTWFTWDKNARVLEAFKIKFPQIFDWNGYDMTLVFQKMMFWTNYKTGFLWYCRNKYFPDEKVYEIDSFYPYNIFKSGLRYIKMRLSWRKVNSGFGKIQDNGKDSGIHLKDDFEVGLYEYFIREAAKTGHYRLFHENECTHAANNSGLPESDVTALNTNLRFFNFPNIDITKVKGDEWYVLTAFFRHWHIINKWMSNAEQIAGSGIRKLMVNEAENGIYGACMGLVMKRHSIKVYNSMNGLKAGQAQDAYINFDKWFVWDEDMKKLMMEKCGIVESRLVVKGHLMEDFARNYEYQHALTLDRESFTGKKVISVFSIKTRRETKLATMNFLYDLIRKDSSYVLIIRPHPLEKQEAFVLPDFKSDRIFWVSYSQADSKSTLYDQILLTDVGIVFGSTVALECKWFGKPCITFEPREQSLLYFADGKDVIHVNNIDSFKKEFNTLVSRHKEKSLPLLNGGVASGMIDYISRDQGII
jgi:hypothetical protein